MDSLRSHWRREQPRVGFLENGESVMTSTPSSKIPRAGSVLKTEVVKIIGLETDKKRSGKRRRFRAVVAVGNGYGTIGLGSKTDKTEKDAVGKASATAEKNIVEIELACFDASPASNHTSKKCMVFTMTSQSRFVPLREVQGFKRRSWPKLS